MVIHVWEATAVQAQPDGAVTPIGVALPLPAPTVCAAEFSVIGHAPAWVTVSVRPAIVTVPVRGDVLVFACALIVTLPLPDPPLAPLKEIQFALLVDVHAQPSFA